jgi:hypothetical protein
MIAARTDLKPGNWQITATTFNCEYVDDAVTIMVDKDWTTGCTWFHRYKQKAIENKKQKFEKVIKIKIEKCRGTECPLAINYRDTLIQQEFSAPQEKIQ